MAQFVRMLIIHPDPECAHHTLMSVPGFRCLDFEIAHWVVEYASRVATTIALTVLIKRIAGYGCFRHKSRYCR